MAEFADYAWLIEDAVAAKLEQLAADSRPPLQQITALRRELSAERARLLVEQWQLRRRATAKFGKLAQRMWFTPVHLEQATDLWVARHKASRFAAAGATTVHDYCCGIGGDLIALAQHGPVTGWDQSPVACLLAEANLRATAEATGRTAVVRCDNVEQLTPAADQSWHVDPDRRTDGRRSTTLALHSPGQDVIDRWRRTTPHGAVKLAPAAAPPSDWLAEAELEWITSGRECRQCVAWFGQLAGARGQRRATRVRVDDDQSQVTVLGTLAGLPDVPCEPAHQPRAYVYDPDPSVLAAGLLGELAANHGLMSLGPGGAYLTGDQAVFDPLLAGFIVNACLPLRPSILARHLAQHGVGRVEIKKRGVSVDPEALRRQLKLRGDGSATVILTRMGPREVAIVAERCSAEPAGVNEAPPGG